jgi:NAD(P)-dependent dehydrogenase (short-subunit alcohol dehydrogenase family)
MLKEFSLRGSTALVTGGGRGIGRAIALTLAEAGADVAVAARTISQVEKVASEILAFDRRSLALKADVTDSSSVDKMVSYTTNQLGKIDILVNVAGISGSASLDSFTDDSWNNILETNLTGPFYCCRAVAQQMLKQRSGRIINVSSTSGAMATVGGSAYNASKAGLNMLTKVLAMEFAPYNVCVNGIGPGWFETDMTKASLETSEQRSQVESIIPMGRLTDLRDLGLLAVYLGSPASSWMTGQVIYLDGGETAAFL